MKDIPLAEFSTIHDDISRYQIIDNTGQLAIFNTNTQNKQNPYNTRDPFLALLTKENTVSSFALDRFAKNGLGHNTLLAYCFEAARTPTAQMQLVTTIFSQIVRIYTEHEEITAQVRDYMATIGENIAERLFADTGHVVKKLNELLHKLQMRQEMSKEEMYAIGSYSLPFNMQYLFQRMQFAAQVQAETTQTILPK